MSRQVVVLARAVDDLHRLHAWVAARAPETANRWLDRFQVALGTLADHAERCPLASENGKVPRELREFHVGRKPSVFRVIFTIDGDTVRILRVRRGQHRPVRRGDLGIPSEPDR